MRLGAFSSFVFPCARQVFESLNGEKSDGMERLVTLDTAGLSDDALHVLDLPLAAAEGAELQSMLAYVWEGHSPACSCACW